MVIEDDLAVEDTAANWDLERARHWHLFSPPARPSPGELTIYAQAIAESQGDMILLGSTPELRLMAHQQGLHVTGYDRSSEVFEHLRPADIPSEQEDFVHGNWMELVYRGRGDLLLADGSLNMVPAELHPGLLDRIADMLQPEGRALIRVHLAAAPRYADAVGVFEGRRRGELAGGMFSATRTQLDMLFIDPVSDSVRFTEVATALAALHSQNLLSEDEHAAYAALAPFNRIELHYTRPERFEAQAAHRFSVRRLGAGGDYADHEQHPIYELRPL